ncbi:hypothetical protein ACIRCZ_18760 [Leifsonia sp. NPDC102414]|uniref:hypothetical protein n=1 Tax=Leifsonia sp. NPDC102414 TaxID=3364124 RepID=UPI003802A8A2
MNGRSNRALLAAIAGVIAAPLLLSGCVQSGATPHAASSVRLAERIDSEQVSTSTLLHAVQAFLTPAQRILPTDALAPLADSTTSLENTMDAVSDLLATANTAGSPGRQSQARRKAITKLDDAQDRVNLAIHRLAATFYRSGTYRTANCATQITACTERAHSIEDRAARTPENGAELTELTEYATWATK